MKIAERCERVMTSCSGVQKLRVRTRRWDKARRENTEEIHCVRRDVEADFDHDLLVEPRKRVAKVVQMDRDI